MLDRWGNSVLMDYRLSKLGCVVDESSVSSALPISFFHSLVHCNHRTDSATTLCGAPEYLAPEQVILLTPIFWYLNMCGKLFGYQSFKILSFFLSISHHYLYGQLRPSLRFCMSSQLSE